MATYLTNHIDHTLINDISDMNMHHDDQDVPLLTDSETETCQFLHLRMTESPHNSKERRQLILATLLCFTFMIAEIIGGYLAGSLAIITDAAHLLSDCISFIVALIAIYLSKKRPDNRMSFGYKRAEVLGAILSIFGIWILTLGLLVLATDRIYKMDFDIDADAMMAVSALGVFINIIMAFILHGDGFCAGHHNHSHAHGHKHHNHHHPHHHKAQNDEHFHNNNRATTTIDLRHKLLHNINADDGLTPSMLLNGRIRSNSTCSYRSPNHSRTNSFSRTLPFNDTARRASHSNHASKLKSLIGGIHQHRDSVDSEITRSLIEPKLASRILIENGGGPGVSTVDAIICPTHNYIQRDDTDNTSVTSDGNGPPIHSNHMNCNSLSSKSINIQAAVIHVIGDFVQSIGVFTSALIIKFYPEAKIADPICTFVFSIIVIFTTVRLMKDSIMIILEAVPSTIDLAALSEELSCIHGVRSIHYLNIWSLTVGYNVMSAHIVVDSCASIEETLVAATTLARKGFDIMHSTIQIERISQPDIHLDEI